MRSFPLAATLVAGVLAAGCQLPQRHQNPATAAKAAECRAQTDRAYRAQNRAALYATDQRDSPFSARYEPGNTARGLGELFGRDTREADCLRDVGAPGPAVSTAPDFQPRGF